MFYILASALVALAAIGQALLLTNSPAWLQAPLAITLVCALPGYAISLAGHSHGRISGSERLFMSIMLSLCSTIGAGVLLHFSPWGITRVSLAFLLGSLTIAACGVAAWRLRADSGEGSKEVSSNPPSPAVTLPSWRAQAQSPVLETHLHAWHMALLAASVVIIIGAVLLAYRNADQATATDVVQLWMLPKAENSSSTSTQLQIGVNNLGKQPLALWLRVERSGDDVQARRQIQLGAGQKWETTLDLPHPLPGSGPIEVILYRADAPSTELRRVSAWVR